MPRKGPKAMGREENGVVVPVVLTSVVVSSIIQEYGCIVESR